MNEIGESPELNEEVIEKTAEKSARLSMNLSKPQRPNFNLATGEDKPEIADKPKFHPALGFGNPSN